METTRKKDLFVVVQVLVGLALALASCAPATSAPPTPMAASAAPTKAVTPTDANVAKDAAPPAATPKPAGEQPRYGGILALNEYGDPPNLDVHSSVNGALLRPIMPIYNGIVQYDPLNPEKVIGDLAEKWEISPDAKSYTFHFAKGIKWQDGKPFTAEDAKYNLQRMQDPKVRSPRAEYLKSIDKMEVPDADTLKLTLNASYALLPMLAIGWMMMMPPQILQVKGDMKKDAMGTGPFKLKDYASGVMFSVVKNKDYFRKDRPYLDGINTYIIKDAAARIAALRTGQVHITIASSAAVTRSQAEAIKKTNPEMVIYDWDTIGTYGVDFNHKIKPLNDVRVRKAVDLAIDRQQAIKVMGDGEGFVASHFPHWGFPPEELVKRPGWRQSKEADRAEAKRLLAEAGYPNGIKARMLARNTQEHLRVAQFHQDQLRTIGIDVTIDPQDPGIVVQWESEGKFEIQNRPNARYLYDPNEVGKKYLSTAAVSGTSGGVWGYNSPKYDELFTKQSAMLDEAERRKVVRQMDDILLEEVPAVISMWRMATIMANPKVRNFKPGLGNYNNYRSQDIWLAP
ncbi:MAG: hypothetical protein HYX92_12975 [Chloroflexi bacterium]|nr:hypothetical protein [Chloroflexota bacterium]